MLLRSRSGNICDICSRWAGLICCEAAWEDDREKKYRIAKNEMAATKRREGIERVVSVSDTEDMGNAEKGPR